MNKSEINSVIGYLNALAAAEPAVAEFYETCCEFWPDEELWKELAPEERRHAEIAARLAGIVEKAPEKFTLLRPLNLAAVRLFTEGVRANQAKVRSLAFKKNNALAASRDIEQSVIESRYEQLLGGGGPEYAALAGELAGEARVHKEKVLARIARLGIIK